MISKQTKQAQQKKHTHKRKLHLSRATSTKQLEMHIINAKASVMVLWFLLSVFYIIISHSALWTSEEKKMCYSSQKTLLFHFLGSWKDKIDWKSWDCISFLAGWSEQEPWFLETLIYYLFTSIPTITSAILISKLVFLCRSLLLFCKFFFPPFCSLSHRQVSLCHPATDTDRSRNNYDRYKIPKIFIPLGTTDTISKFLKDAKAEEKPVRIC